MSSTSDRHILYLILEAIQKGASTDRKLHTRLTGLSRELLENTIKEAEKQGLIQIEEQGHIIRRRTFKLTEKGKQTLEQLRKEVLSQVENSLKQTHKLIKEGKHEEAKKKAKEIEHIVPALAAMGILQEMVDDTLLLTFLTNTLGVPITPVMLDFEEDNVEDI